MDENNFQLLNLVLIYDYFDIISFIQYTYTTYFCHNGQKTDSIITYHKIPVAVD